MKSIRQQLHEARQRERRQLLSQRASKMAAAKVCFENAKFYHDGGNLPGTMYWEQEYRRCTAEAGAITR